MIILVPLLFVILILPYLYESYLASKQAPFDQSGDSLYYKIKRLAKKKAVSNAILKEIKILDPVAFDPNITGKSELVRMGVDERVANNIINYRSKGGQFRVKDDLSKIYGMDNDVFMQLKPFIELPDSIERKPKFIKKPTRGEPKKPTLFDINQADTLQLKRIRGIGSVLSKRIINFRDRLGGFHSINQLSEVYGLKDTVVLRIRERFYVKDSSSITKLDLLKSTAEQLRSHPYINYRLSDLIVAYRKQHQLTSIDQLKEIKIVTDSIYEKVRPYLYLGEK